MPLSLSIQSTPSRPIHGVQVVRPVHKVRLGVQRKDTLCIREEPQTPLDSMMGATAYYRLCGCGEAGTQSTPSNPDRE